MPRIRKPNLPKIEGVIQRGSLLGFCIGDKIKIVEDLQINLGKGYVCGFSENMIVGFFPDSDFTGGLGYQTFTSHLGRSFKKIKE